MARLDGADRQGALKVMGKLFEELAAATNASGKDIKRENNKDKDEKLDQRYSKKESVRLSGNQEGVFQQFNNLITAGNLILFLYTLIQSSLLQTSFYDKRLSVPLILCRPSFFFLQI